MAAIRVTVRFFAAARERTRVAEHRLELPGPATVEDVTKALVAAFPALGPLMRHLRVAVDQEFADAKDAVPDGAEVALIPPVAGGAPGGLFRVVDEPLSLTPVVEAVSKVSHGGLVTFTGVVRDHSKGKRVTRLDYEAYAPMAEKKLAEIAGEAREKWPGAEVAVMHRVGTLAPGELAVVIAVSAPHRKEAFRACEYVIDRLKEDVPIWKKEFAEDGEVWVGLGP
ncbi:MAG: molybdenum cofactor biosynthesis protein MoaE [Myxococcota bacterium]|jgi:molybdopterin synthase catalytic subunit